ncbi:hypothetical protein ABZW18_23615 [Streptomyces sp. NPDC004647]|uniref:COG4315 family predicted lipoprotein n=1 Tax=Streptomyces sp. NPDC004647 TaxID=3154671 RepID=UPI0033B2601A
MRTRNALLAAPLVPLALLTLSACGGGGDAKDGGDTAKAAAAQPVSVKVADSDAGPILVDQSGRTLYGFTKDKGRGEDGANSCDADCIAVWPALTSTSDVKAGKGTQPSLLRGTERGEGATQATYGEWPLYYYVGDSAPGDVNGQGLDGEWFVVAADGKLVKKTV